MSGEDSSRVSRRPGLLLEVVVWWGLCLGVWLISLSAVPVQELLTALVVSLPCGLAGALARRAAGNTWTFRASWFRVAAVLPVAVLIDVADVLIHAIPGLRRHGSIETIYLSGGEGRGSQASGRRAVATFWMSVTPGTFVADIDPESGEMVFHRLAQSGPRLEQVVAG